MNGSTTINDMKIDALHDSLKLEGTNIPSTLSNKHLGIVEHIVYYLAMILKAQKVSRLRLYEMNVLYKMNVEINKILKADFHGASEHDFIKIHHPSITPFSPSVVCVPTLIAI